MKYEKCISVYSCCGEYIGRTKATKDSKLNCPRCGALLDKPITVPTIVIAKVR